MISLRNFLTLITLSFFFSACNESASSKINTDNKSSIQKESIYAEIAFDRVLAKSKKSSFFATKSVSHLILQTVKSVFDSLL